VSAVLAERLLAVETILQITAGTILEFDVPFSRTFRWLWGTERWGAGRRSRLANTSDYGSPESIRCDSASRPWEKRNRWSNQQPHGTFTPS
jgi:hypothetical protein